MGKMNRLKSVALRAFVLGTFLIGFSSPRVLAVEVDTLFNYWNDRYVTGVDIIQLPRPLDSILDTEVLAKAAPDECFFDIGSVENEYDPDIDIAQCNGDPKVNQAYVWGLTKAGDNLWFGTGPNTHCLVLGTYLQSTTPTINENYVCEFGASQFASAYPELPESVGDWRPPRIFAYDTQSDTLTEKTNDVYGFADDLGASLQRLSTCVGIRSAGTLNDIVILGGPGYSTESSLVVHLFAFNAQDGTFIGSTSLTDYTNIRKWLVVDGVLYTAVGGGESGGAVLRWVGTTADPFSGGDINGFDIVGTLDATGAELALHENRLFVSTWPGEELAAQGEAGIYMSPILDAAGLTSADAEPGIWTKVWEISDYEPDPVTAKTYGGGAIASFGGYLYWGTMNVPLLSTIAHFTAYSGLVDAGLYPEAEDSTIKAFLATHRPVSVFRGRNFGMPNKEVELLYGLNQMYAFNPPGSPSPLPVGWNLVPNNMAGAEPLYGQAGFGNFYNNYTWTMSVFNGKLYVGTMDFSILFSDFATASPAFAQVAPRSDLGADLMRFDSTAVAATGESYNGVGNYSTYGIRTMVADDALYLGMANPMNLRTDPADALGGWELVRAIEKEPDNESSGSSGGGGGSCFISASGVKYGVIASPVFAIFLTLGFIGVIFGLSIVIQRKTITE